MAGRFGPTPRERHGQLVILVGAQPVELDSRGVELLAFPGALVRWVAGDLGVTSATAHRPQKGQGIQQWVRAAGRHRHVQLIPSFAEPDRPELVEQLEARIESLRTGQAREPSAPGLLHRAVNGLLLEGPWEMSEQVDRDEFWSCKERLGRIRTPALILQRGGLIVGGANPQKELNELNFWFHNPTLKLLLGLHSYPYFAFYFHVNVNVLLFF